MTFRKAQVIAILFHIYSADTRIVTFQRFPVELVCDGTSKVRPQLFR